MQEGCRAPGAQCTAVHDSIHDALEAIRARLGVPPLTMQITTAGVRCTVTSRFEVLKMETDNGRITHRQQRAVDEMLQSARDATSVRNHATTL